MPRPLKWALGIGTLAVLAFAALLLVDQSLLRPHNFESSFDGLIAALILTCWGLVAGGIVVLWVLVRAVSGLASAFGSRMAALGPGDLHSKGYEDAEDSDGWEDLRDADDLPG